MTHILVKEWIDERTAKGLPKLSEWQFYAVVDFVEWLDRRPSTRGADLPQQTCPDCGGKGSMNFQGSAWICDLCHGTGQI